MALCYLTSMVLLSVFAVGFCQSVCPAPYLFTCDDNTCISAARMRDGSRDCPNGEDEFSEVPLCGCTCKPRNESMASANGYRCRKNNCDPSRRNSCKARNKRCICDDECGYTCVSPDSSCPRRGIPNIPNSNGYEVLRHTGGELEVLHDPPTFKHRDMIRYKCRQGLSLVGPLPRCNSLRQWTRQLPICKVDYCARNPCFNGGTCANRPSTYICYCPSTYTGRNCETELQNPCDDDPCENGGTCHLIGNYAFTCNCPPGFSGASCSEVLFDPCQDNPCQNGGTCRAVGDYDVECICQPGYSGDSCDDEVFCFPPATPDRGYLVGENKRKWRYGDIATFQCLEDFRLVGNNTIQCGEGGAWSKITAVCQRMLCRLDYFLLPTGIVVRGFSAERLYDHKFHVGDIVTLKCKQGLRPAHNNVPFSPPRIRCETGGEWMPPYFSITCERLPHVVTCETPGHIAGLILVEVSEGIELAAKCSEGFTLIGDERVICLDNGSWTEFPTCVPDSPAQGACEYPSLSEELLHDRFPEQDQFPLGSVLNVRCKEGFSQSGSGTIECQSDGTWSELPLCEKEAIGEFHNLCDDDPCNNGGTCHLTSDLAFTCDCAPGYSGASCSEELFDPCEDTPCHNGGTCRTTGDYDVECICQPGYSGDSCDEEVFCSRPAAPDRGYFAEKNKRIWRYGETVTFRCLDDFRLVGNTTIQCREDGNWSKMTAVCQRMICRLDYLLLPVGVVVSGFSADSLYDHKFHADDVVTLGCQQGFRPALNNATFSPSQLRCEYGGTWMPPYYNISCERLPHVISCVTPEPTDELIFDEISEGNELAARCREGLTLMGDERITCLNNGSWTELPICVPVPTAQVTCGYPSLPEEVLSDHFPEQDGFTPGSVMVLRCKEGFNQIGPETIECLSNGTWSEYPLCEEELFEELGCLLNFEDLRDEVELDLPDGGIIKDLYSVGESVDLFCEHLNKRPYSLSTGFASPSITCKDDFTWFPRMEDVDCVQICRRPLQPENGLLVLNILSNFYFLDETVLFQCPPLHRLGGSNKITCREDGTWTEMEPCLPLGCWIDVRMLNETVVLSGHDKASLAGVEFPVGHEMQVECANKTHTLNSNLPPVFTCEGRKIWSQDYTTYTCHAPTCENRCLTQGGPCACDFGCEKRSDCCDDFIKYCEK